MPYPSAQQIAYGRAKIEQTLTAACTIYRATNENTTPYVLVEETVCDVEMYDPLASPFQITPQSITDESPRWISLPFDADVERGYEIDVGTHTYYVQDTTTDDTDPWLVVARCNLIATAPNQPTRP